VPKLISETSIRLRFDQLTLIRLGAVIIGTSSMAFLFVPLGASMSTSMASAIFKSLLVGGEWH